jgi:hypothetical protein
MEELEIVAMMSDEEKKAPKPATTEMILAEELRSLSNITTYNEVARNNQADRLVGLLTDMIEAAVEKGIELGIEMHKDEFNHDLLYE